MTRRDLALRYCVALTVALVTSIGFVTSAATADAGPPYTDTSAVGSIGLCTQSGTQITSGNVNATPFVWRAVSTTPAPAPYNNAGRTATLFAYQPQQGLTPGEWSGDELTASSSYSNPANPMAAATSRDFSLEDFIQEYPPRWDGYLQLRIYLSTANEAAYEVHYPALNIKVTGTTWTAVGGTTVNCASGTAQSLESVVLPTTTSPKSSPAPGKSGAPGSTTDPSGSSTPEGTTGGAGTHPAGPGATQGGTTLGRGTALADASPTSNHDLLVGLIAAAAVLLAATGFVVRRRRPAVHSPESQTTGNSSTKGHRP